VVTERIFMSLAAEYININMITTGDIKISVLVDKADGTRALRAVHQAFNLHQPHAGAGLPGAVKPTSYRPRPAAIIEEAPGRDITFHTLQLSCMENIVVSDVLLNTEERRITISELPDRRGN